MLPHEIPKTKSTRFEHPTHAEAWEIEGYPGTQGNHPDTQEPITVIGVICPKCHTAVAFHDYGEKTHVCGALLKIVEKGKE
jgi:hypothetical protein